MAYISWPWQHDRSGWDDVPSTLFMSDGTKIRVPAGASILKVRHENGDEELYVGPPKKLKEIAKREQDS